MNCHSVDDVKELGIDIVAKARLLFNKIIELKSNQINLSSYFRLPDNTVVESSQAGKSSQAPINDIDDDVCEFTLQGSGLEDTEVKVVVSIGAVLKTMSIIIDQLC